jgi:hypothetical protein
MWERPVPPKIKKNPQILSRHRVVSCYFSCYKKEEAREEEEEEEELPSQFWTSLIIPSFI